MRQLALIPLVLIMSLIFLAGCSASGKNKCGCPPKKGMVGY
jgi:hypothetical protein